MLVWIYRLLALVLLVGTVRAVLRTEKVRDQVAFSLVLIPLLLRVLFIR